MNSQQVHRAKPQLARSFFANLQQQITEGAAASRNRSAAWRYGTSLLALGAAIAFRELLEPGLGDRLPYITLFGAIAFVAWFCGTKPAILIVILGDIATELFFIHPTASFSLNSPPYLIGRVAYLATAAVLVLMGHLAAESEKASIEQRIKLEIAQQAATAGFYEWEIHQHLGLWSPELRDIYGIPSTQPSTLESWKELLHPEDRESAFAKLAEILDSDATEFEFLYRIVTPALKVKSILSRGCVIRDAHGAAQRVIGLVIDITRQKAVEEALLRNEKLLAATRMASTVAHEINNPLQGILTMLYLIRSDRNLSPQTAKLADAVEDEIRYVAGLAQRSMSFFHDPRAVETVDLDAVVSEVVNMHRAKAQRCGVSIRTEIEQPCALLFSATELKQVLSNLIHNAVDAMQGNGGTLAVSSHSREGWMELTVEDSGTGIEPDHVDKIFDPFFTTKSAIGTGLGLWVSKSIIESHGGTISVQTSTQPELHGTKFTVRLPLRSQSTCSASANAAAD